MSLDKREEIGKDRVSREEVSIEGRLRGVEKKVHGSCSIADLEERCEQLQGQVCQLSDQLEKMRQQIFGEEA